MALGSNDLIIISFVNKYNATWGDGGEYTEGPRIYIP